MSIKTKLLTLLVVSLLVVGMIIAGSGMFVLYQQTLHSTQITMNNQTVQLSGQVSDLFESFDKSGQVYGQDSELQSGDPARIQAKINTYYHVAWGVDRLNFLDVTGCPALRFNKETKKVKIDEKQCVGCEVCLQVCPVKAIERVGE